MAWQFGQSHRKFSIRLSLLFPLMWSSSKLIVFPSHSPVFPHPAHLYGIILCFINLFLTTLLVVLLFSTKISSFDGPSVFPLAGNFIFLDHPRPIKCDISIPYCCVFFLNVWTFPPPFLLNPNISSAFDTERADAQTVLKSSSSDQFIFDFMLIFRQTHRFVKRGGRDGIRTHSVSNVSVFKTDMSRQLHHAAIKIGRSRGIRTPDPMVKSHQLFR